MFGANKKTIESEAFIDASFFFEKTLKNIDKKFVFTIYIYI